MEIEKANQ